MVLDACILNTNFKKLKHTRTNKPTTNNQNKTQTHNTQQSIMLRVEQIVGAFVGAFVVQFQDLLVFASSLFFPQTQTQIPTPPTVVPLHVNAADAQLALFDATTPAGFVEPLLRPDRMHIGTIPAARLDIEELYVRSRDSFWEEREIDLVQDRKHWDELSDGERFFLSRVLAFFSQSDALVAENCSCNFGVEITWPEFRQLFAWQASMEWIHARTYSVLLNTYIRDSAEREILEKSIESIKTIAEKAAWMRAYMDPAKPLAARLAAFVVCEGVFFSASFCAIFYMKKRGKLPGLAHSNELIARDESLHTETSALAYSKLERKLPEAYVHAMFDDAVAIEREFVRDSIPIALLGMNADAMCAYVEFVADYWLENLGYSKLFRTANPFEWMDLGALTGKTNFFERKVGEYARALRDQQQQHEDEDDENAGTRQQSVLAQAFAGDIDF